MSLTDEEAAKLGFKYKLMDAEGKVVAYVTHPPPKNIVKEKPWKAGRG